MRGFETTKALIEACLENADELLWSAKTVREQRLNNIAYHLASLSLEEIGKATIILMTAAADVVADRDRPLEKWMEDHVRKLFWALWGPTFGRQSITGDQIRSFMDLANAIHKNRLDSLYVNPAGPPARVKIADAEVDTLVSICEGRLELAKIETFVEPDADTKKDIQWLFTLFDDPERGAFIRTAAAQAKLTELGDSLKWIRWIRETFEETDRVGRELAERELTRAQPTGQEIEKPKWRLKIRLHSGSHSIRSKALTIWNQKVPLIQLHSAKKPDELLVDFTLIKNVPVQGVWHLGFRMSRAFVGALNVATLGFFWWYLPEYTSSFYDKLLDLESKSEVRLERNPPLRVNWDKKRVLTEGELTMAGAVYAYLISNGRDQLPEFENYMRGVSLLGKNDLFFRSS